MRVGRSFNRSSTLPLPKGCDLEKKLPLNRKEGQVLGADAQSWAPRLLITSDTSASSGGLELSEIQLEIYQEPQ